MDHPELLFEEARLKTFRNWPYSNDTACSPEKMAEAGFYACGSTEDPDEARCFVCMKQLDGWEETDDPWEEHKSHAPKCMFVKFGKKESELTVYQIYDLDLERQINVLKAQYNERKKEIILKVPSIKKKIAAMRRKQKN